ncbi:hypothetical protein CMV_005679 [Castanea mollissima]|uniref:Uncharacterized protein n=1 Tax=Castanea mollissima TaxID=60419 RepID=A0A8J4RWN6_9ROSI|nr:hypothetical protein CMV_005679 [Castanea mollissima]
MKAILIVCLLLASIFFIPSSNAASSCSLKLLPQPLKPVAPPLKLPTPPTECSLIRNRSCAPPPRRQPYIR